MPEETIIQAATETAAPDPEIRDMIDAGVFFGRTKTKTNPRMKQFIMGNRNGIEIINLEKTKEFLNEALAFLKEAVKTGKGVLLVGTQPAAVEAVKEVAKEFGLPFVTVRWLGGTLTNYKVISRRVDYFKKLRTNMESGALEKYTKKERLGIERELEKLKNEVGSLEAMVSRPDCLVVVDPHLHRTAVHEANNLGIPVVALANSDANPDKINHIVPGNNKSRVSIQWFLRKIAEAIREGKKGALAFEAQKNSEKAAAEGKTE